MKKEKREGASLCCGGGRVKKGLVFTEDAKKGGEKGKRNIGSLGTLGGIGGERHHRN